MARFPIAKTSVFTGSDLPATGGTLSDGPICMSNLGSKLRQQGALSKSIKFAGAAMGMIGADFCIHLPGLDTSATDLKFGLKISGTMFDKDKIDLTKFTALLPKAYNTVPDPASSAWTSLKTAAGDTDAKGFVDLLNHALTLAPLGDCGAVCGDYSKWSLNSEFKAQISSSVRVLHTPPRT